MRTHRSLVAIVPLVLATTLAETTPAQETEEELVARAQGIHDRIITLDTHIDFTTDNFTDDRNYPAH